MNSDQRFLSHQFPRSNAYHPEWVLESVSGGANALWLIEWLTSALDLKSGMNLLDLGCGRAASSIFLAREYDATVWATDFWFSASDNLRRVRDAGFAQRVYPIHADARRLPFAPEFFDAIVSIDAFPYFGTDDHYLNYLARFVKPGGVIAIASAGLLNEIEEDVPTHLSDWFRAEPSLWSLHSAAWWRRHWERTGIVDVELADAMPNGWRLWLAWHEIVAPENRLEIQTIEADAGRYLGYNRVVGRRRQEVCLDDIVTSIPSTYAAKPLLRGDA